MRKILISLLLAFPTLPATAAEFLPPPDLVEAAIDAHPAVNRAAARLSGAEAEARRLRAGPHEFVASAGYVRRDVEREGRFDEWEGSVSRAIRLPGKAGLDRRAGALGIEAQKNSADDARHQTALLLADYWMAWLKAEELARLDTADAETWERERQAMARRVTLRDAAVLDLDLVETSLARARAALAQSSGAAREAREALGHMFPELALPAEPPVIAAPDGLGRSRDEWYDLVLTRSHELRFAELEMRRLATLATRADRDRWADPSVGLRVFSERGGEEKGIGLVLSVPLGGGYRRATADMAKADASAATADLARVRREVEETASRDIARVEAGFLEWQQMAAASKASASVLARTQRGHDLRDRSLADLLLAMRQHQEARRAELAARAAAQAALLKLRIDAHELWLTPHAEELADSARP